MAQVNDPQARAARARKAQASPQNSRQHRIGRLAGFVSESPAGLRRDSQTKDQDAALRALVRSFEYEDWPRGRIVYDRLKERFTLYADASTRRIYGGRSTLERQAHERLKSPHHYCCKFPPPFTMSA